VNLNCENLGEPGRIRDLTEAVKKAIENMWAEMV
jgi:hypothetical protein